MKADVIAPASQLYLLHVQELNTRKKCPRFITETKSSSDSLCHCPLP